jgi:hypothetical protein
MTSLKSEIKGRRSVDDIVPPGFLQIGLRCALVASATLLLVVPAYSAETLKVTIINRRYNATEYTYTAPAQAVAESNSTANCSASGSNVSCYGSTRTTASEVEAHTTSYSVQGATLTLQLSDGRIAIVNCASKYSPKGDYINARSCRQPLVDDIQVEFRGSNAKLKWPVSIDGKKMESETYKIVAFFAASLPALVYPIATDSQSTSARVPSQIEPESTHQSGSGAYCARHPAGFYGAPGTASGVNCSAEKRDAVGPVQSPVVEQVGDGHDATETMTWFDEPAPGPSTETRDVTITARAYDGVLNILSKLRDSDTSVKSGVSVLDVGYHPRSFRLSAGLSKNQSVTVFCWDDESVVDNTLVMRIKVTRRVYENVTNAVGHLRTTAFTKR